MTAAIADKLAEARKLIERGWCQGEYTKEGCVCAYGAIQCAVTGDAEIDSDPRTMPLEEMLRRAIDYDLIVSWNDDPGRTQAEVIDAFKRAEQLAREGAE